MIAQTLQQPVVERGLRPMNPFRDMGQVADLIELAFREDASLIGSEAIAEMRRWRGWRAWLWSLTLTDSLMSGFVWVEEGRIVGNISIGLANAIAGYWLISNVAVHPDYRRRGIARRLLETALDWIRTRGGHVVLLQVRSDNAPAQQLYRSHGFLTYHSEVDMQRLVSSPQQPVPPTALPWRPLRSADRATVRELMRTVLPPAIRQFKIVPYVPFVYRGGADFDEWLGDLLAQRHTHQQILGISSEVRAVVEVQAQRSPHPHRLSFLVSPRERGKLEQAAVQQGLSLLNRHPPRAVLCTVAASAPDAVTALGHWGFVEARRLDQMKLEFMEK